MKKEIKIPDIAENVDTGIIGRILVSKGDEVKKDQPVVEVETDKAATDIPSPFEGTIDEIRVNEGDEVSVGDVIMIVEVTGEAGADEEEQPEEQEKKGAADGGEEREAEGDQEEQKEPAGDQEKKSAAGEDADEARDGDETLDEDEAEGDEGDEADEDEDEDEDDEGDEADKQDEDAAEDIPAAPSVRRMAREAGVDLAEVRGSGPGNRITAEDIASAKKGKEEQSGKDEQAREGEKKKEQKATGKPSKAGPAEREKAIELPDFSQWGATKKEKMNTVRKITARTMTASWQQIPQVTQFDEADITEIEAFRQKHKESYDKKGGKLTITAILLKIAAYALQKFPRFNSSLDTSDNTLVMKQYIHIGIAVDTDKGLIVPVIKDTDKKSLAEISVETVELAKKARENEISLDALQGGNFTISNLGGIGGTGFTPIVYAPQVAILGVSRASYKQVFLEDRFQQRLVLPLTLTYDHRVIDGADGARFLRWICDVLEDPYALLQ